MSLRVLVCLFLALVSFPGTAITVGTQQQCLKLGGTWEKVKHSETWEKDDWEGYCFVYWQAEKCEAENGSWSPAASRCRLELTLKDFKVQCKENGGIWKDDGCFFEEEKRRCLAEGGEWKRMGRRHREGCLIPSRDAEAPCSSSSQCQFGCIATGKPEFPDAEVVGKCAKNNGPGCKAIVENGHIAMEFCAD